MSDADRERLIKILKLGSCPSPYLCDENCKYANLENKLHKSLFVDTFRDQITGESMYDIAFQYEPYWSEK